MQQREHLPDELLVLDELGHGPRLDGVDDELVVRGDLAGGGVHVLDRLLLAADQRQQPVLPRDRNLLLVGRLVLDLRANGSDCRNARSSLPFLMSSREHRV